VNRVFRWIVRSSFAPVTGNAGAIASTLGFFLAFLPLDSLRIPLLLAFLLLLRLNIIALFLETCSLHLFCTEFIFAGIYE
jgi:F0F1-type ATP synthase assembly protein I